MNNLLITSSQLLIALSCTLACLIVLAAVCGVIIACLVHKTLFTRQDKNPAFKYFTEEEFGVSSEKIDVNYRRVVLNAKIYFVKPPQEVDKVVIFQHGFGAGTSSYTTEICALAKRGYAVVAADAYGCNNSQGKKTLGFYGGAEAVIAAYIAVKGDARLKDKPVVLMGHSWGAYSVLAASNKIAVQGVVAMSAFNSPSGCVCSQLKAISPISKLVAPLIRPWLALINLFTFGVHGNDRAAKCIEKSKCKALIIHGAKDKTVPYEISAASKAEGEGVTKLILEDKYHNPYNTVEAEAKLKELMRGREFATAEERDKYFASFDWALATAEDETVMDAVYKFIEEA